MPLDTNSHSFLINSTNSRINNITSKTHTQYRSFETTNQYITMNPEKNSTEYYNSINDDTNSNATSLSDAKVGQNISRSMRPEESQQSSQIDLKSPEVQEKLDKLYRKLDLRIIPPLWCLYFLTSMGTSLYGNSLTMNMETNNSLRQQLKLTPHDTSTASALYYVGYILFDVPMNLLMTKLAPQAWLSRIVMTVGIVYACYASLSSSGGLIAVRLIAGICGAGTWPGMAYYISLWYPSHRTARRIGYYFTAAQLSASVAGLIAAGFQKMNMERGLTGFQWMYMLYGIVTFLVGFSLVWWLPDRPFKVFNDQLEGEIIEGDRRIQKRGSLATFVDRFIPTQKPVLTPEEQELHKADMYGRYLNVSWGLMDLWKVFLDFRLWPLVIMYFGVVGTGYGIVVFGTTILKSINSSWSSVTLSLLMAPIWMCDLIAILLITPFSDKFKNWRNTVFSSSTVVIIVGLVVTTYSPGNQWSRYGGLLITGFGLGPTVPVCMTVAAEVFAPRHGDLGTAASAALVSGLGNLGSVTTTYALYSGWPADIARGYEYSNMVMVAILGASIIAAGINAVVNGYVPVLSYAQKLRNKNKISDSTV